MPVFRKVKKMEEQKKKKNNKRTLWIIRGLIAVCVIGLAYSGYSLLSSYLEYKRGDKEYADLTQFISEPSSSPENPSPDPTPPTPQQQNGDDEPTEPVDSGEVPDTDEPSNEKEQITYVDNTAPHYWPEIDFESLKAINSDFCAWILCPGTNINYPVARGSDNDFYLDHLFNKKSNKAGAIFMDYRNDTDFSNRNTIIYGHHMKNRSMFWTLTNYKQQSFYNNNPVVRIVTENGNYEVHLFAAYVASTSDNAWRVGFKGEEDFLSWVQEAIDKSDFKSDVAVAYGDKLVTLSTCTYEFSDARYVVLGKLVAV